MQITYNTYTNKHPFKEIRSNTCTYIYTQINIQKLWANQIFICISSIYNYQKLQNDNNDNFFTIKKDIHFQTIYNIFLNNYFIYTHSKQIQI